MLQRDVVQSRSPIKWSMPQPRMDTAKTRQVQEREMERKYKDTWSTTGGQIEGCQTRLDEI